MTKNKLPWFLPEDFYEELEKVFDQAEKDFTNFTLLTEKIVKEAVHEYFSPISEINELVIKPALKRSLTRKLLCVLGAVSVYAGVTTAGDLYQDYVHNPVVSVKPSYDDSDYDDLFLGAEVYQDNSKKELE